MHLLFMAPQNDHGDFQGFDKKALKFLSQMPSWDERTYAKHKAQLARGLREPGWALISSVAERLDSSLQVDKRSSISPLHRDLRFAKAGTPRYKDHMLLTAWEGNDRKTSAMLWIRVDAASIGFASGLSFTPAQREKFRSFVGEKSGEALQSEITRLAKKHKNHGFDLAGASLKKVPPPYPSDHPRADLLKMTSFQVRFHEAHPKVEDGPELLAWCTTRLEDLLGVHRLLVSKVQS